MQEGGCDVMFVKPRWRNMCWDTEGGLCRRCHECVILLGSRTNSPHPERASSMCGRDATKSREIHRVLQRKVYDTPASCSNSKGSRVKCWLWKLEKIWVSSITAFLLPHKGVRCLLPRDLTWSPAGRRTNENRSENWKSHLLYKPVLTGFPTHSSVYTGCYCFSSKKVTRAGVLVELGEVWGTSCLVGTLNFYQSPNRCSIP